VSTYALAIQHIISSEQTPKNQERRRRPEKKKKKPSGSNSPPFYIDLYPVTNSRVGRRGSSSSSSSSSGGTSDLLLRAVSPRKGSSATDGAIICDLTAGLGQDSLVLAMNGAQHVHMVERNPIVAALLHDAMRRLELIAQTQKDEVATMLVDKLSLVSGDAKDWMSRKQDQEPVVVTDCDVIYLDPMFPPRQKSSAVKKGMAILHGLLDTQTTNDTNDDNDDDEHQKEQEEKDLLLLALDTARLRVVVKRPIKAPPLGTTSITNDEGIPKPSYSISGSINRWDVYVVKSVVVSGNLKSGS
jgi:16S rRNA (guanine1516-N2)-methyltransferase